MAEDTKANDNKKKKKTKKKTGFFKGLRAEFKKIIWPSRDTLVKQTIAVVLVAVVLCLVIALLDTVISTGIGYLMR